MSVSNWDLEKRFETAQTRTEFIIEENKEDVASDHDDGNVKIMMMMKQWMNMMILVRMARLRVTTLVSKGLNSLIRKNE